MYAIAEDRNRQIKLREGDVLRIDYHPDWKPGTEVVLDKVCLIGGDEVRLGDPYLPGCKVFLTVEAEEKGRKVVVGKFKRRKNYRRKKGFRAQYLRVRVARIEA